MWVAHTGQVWWGSPQDFFCSKEGSASSSLVKSNTFSKNGFLLVKLGEEGLEGSRSLCSEAPRPSSRAGQTPARSSDGAGGGQSGGHSAAESRLSGQCYYSVVLSPGVAFCAVWHYQAL